MGSTPRFFPSKKFLRRTDSSWSSRRSTGGERTAEVLELLTLFAHGVFILLALLSFLEFLRKRTRPRRDTLLFFLPLGLVVLSPTWFGRFDPPLALTLLLSVLLWASWGLWRVVGHLRRVPDLSHRILRNLHLAAAGTLLLLLSPPPWSARPLSDLPLLAVVGTALGTFLLSSFEILRSVPGSIGFHRERLLFASWGSGLLGLGFLGSLIEVGGGPPLSKEILPLVASGAALFYYLGFSPPRWIRRSAEAPVLRSFLLSSREVDVRKRAWIMRESLPLSALRIVGGSAAVVSFRQELGWRVVATAGVGSKRIPPDFPGIPSRSESVLSSKKPLLLGAAEEMGDLESRIIQELGLRFLLCVPFDVGARSRGIVALFLEFEPLFPEEDIELLEFLAHEVALAQAHADLLEASERLTEDLARTNDSLRKANEEIELFSRIASHDLQEPLRAVSFKIQKILARSELSEEVEKALEDLRTDVSRMQALVRILLLYSQASLIPIRKVPVDLNDVRDSVLERIRAAFEEVGGRVESDRLPTIPGDPTLLEHLFQNLLGNSLKHRSPHRPLVVRIRCRKEGESCALEFEDNGRGIPPEERSRILSLHPTTRGGFSEGSGVGLLIVQRVVERHGGSIECVEPQELGGARFVVRLPLNS